MPKKNLTDLVNVEDVKKYVDTANVNVWEVEDNDGLWELYILYGTGDEVTKHHYDIKKKVLHIDFKFYKGFQVEKAYKLLIPAGTKKVKVDKVKYYIGGHKDYKPRH
ncbi:hypothetical protein FJZ53_02765 [Candidatus Woesearchaeota archaeon]|nr:hypothetical protein [Candidatus Woesearchaeota archaeon]